MPTNESLEAALRRARLNGWQGRVIELERKLELCLEEN
jgi:hypothetical protein